MKTFESRIDLFDNIYGIGEAAEITVCYRLDNGDQRGVGVYFTVIRHDGEDDIEVYDMKRGRKFIIEGEFLIVCTLLGLSLDPMDLDPVSVTDEWIDPVFGCYTVTMKNGKWVDYNIFFDEAEKCREAIKAVWNTYDEDPDTIAVYNE